MSVEVVLKQMVIIAILMAVGYYFKRKEIVNKDGVRQISAIVANICNPALLISSVLGQESKASNQDVLLLGLIALVIFILMAVVGKILAFALRAPKDEWNYYTMMTMFGNTGFIGIPLATAVFGTSSLIYVAVFNFMYNMFIYTYGVKLLADAGGQKARIRIRMFINPGTIASVLTMILFFADIHLPVIAEDALGYMGGATTFLAMFAIGTSLADVSFSSIFTEYRLYPFIAIRFIVFPVLVSLVLARITGNVMMAGTAVLMTAVPVGNLPLMMAAERGLDAKVLAKGILLTTIMALVTIPVVTMLVG